MSRILTKNRNGNHKFNIIHIQQSTLAGGVAIGTCCDLYLTPTGAIIIGIFAGILSVIGYIFISDPMEFKLKISDTKGVHNVHGLPGLFFIGNTGKKINLFTFTYFQQY